MFAKNRSFLLWISTSENGKLFFIKKTGHPHNIASVIKEVSSYVAKTSAFLSKLATSIVVGESGSPLVISVALLVISKVFSLKLF